MTRKLLTYAAVHDALYCCGPAGSVVLAEFLRRHDYDLDGRTLEQHLGALIHERRAVVGSVELPGYPAKVQLYALVGQGIG